MITLVHPWALALLALPLILRAVLPAHRESSRGVYVPKLGRVAALAGAEVGAGAAVRRRARLQAIGVAIVWALLVGAVARPRLVEPPIEKTTPTRDVLLALDLSGSMSTEDMTLADGSRADRLAVCKEVLDEFLSKREGDRVGLVLFGSSAFVQSPFTEDLSVCRALLDETQIGMTGPRTVIGDAIGLSISVFERSELEDRVLILLTDGNDTGSRVSPTDAAGIARDRGITIHVVAVGDPKAAGEQPLDEETLRAVASTTGGVYGAATDRAELEGMYEQLDEITTHEVSTVSFSPTRDLFQWLVGLATALALAYFVLSDLRWSASNGWNADGLRAGAIALVVTVAVGYVATTALHVVLLRPLWLVVVPVAAVLASRARAQVAGARAAERFMDPHLMAALAVGGDDRRRIRPAHVLFAVLAASGVALSGPAWDEEPSPFAEQGAAFVVALEVTPTMLAQDVQPSRLERAIMKVQDLLDARSASRAALVAYAGSAHLVAPLTRDHEVFRPFLVDLVPEIMPKEGDAASAAVDVAARHLAASGYPGAILLVTDEVAPAEVESIRALREGGAPSVHVWGIAADETAVVPPGSPPAPTIDVDALREAAKAGGGTLTVVGPDGSDVERVASRLESSILDAPPGDGEGRWRDRGYELVWLLLLLVVPWFRRGWVVRVE